MKIRVFFATVLLTLLNMATFLHGMAQPTNPAGFVIHRGVNLSHWLSQDFGWAPREAWITENDIRYIARIGFDHVRLPIDEKELWSENGQPNEPEFNRLLTAIEWCRKAKLRVIVDLHTVNSHHFNAANEGLSNTLWTDSKAQGHFLSLWRDLSARLKQLPVAEVAYEILNEPVADNDADWNKLVAKALQQIRSSEPSRVLIIGANRWQSPANVPALELPAGDKNIILSVHTYSPLFLTHHLADWVPVKVYKGPVAYPGPVVDAATLELLKKDPTPGLRDHLGDVADNWGPDRIRQIFAPAIKRARELGLQLYCGEFGCLPTVPRAARLAYYRDIVTVMQSEGMAYANWEYKGDFGIFEWHGAKILGGAPDVELIDTLLPDKH
ncbi:MAG: cellulase family glycosylhydrolase [Nibricoccus sp.]